MSLHPSQEDLFTALKTDDAEIRLLKMYQGHYSHIIQSEFRSNGKKDEIWQNVENAMNKGLNGLVQCNNVTLYRNELNAINDGNEPIVFNWFTERKGQVICFPSFISCYQDERSCPILEGGVTFIINTKADSKAFDVNVLNPNGTENEAIFKTNSCFRIDDVNITNRCLVNLSEVEFQEPNIKVFKGEQYFELARNRQDDNIIAHQLDI